MTDEALEILRRVIVDFGRPSPGIRLMEELTRHSQLEGAFRKKTCHFTDAAG